MSIATLSGFSTSSVNTKAAEGPRERLKGLEKLLFRFIRLGLEEGN
jgi:hypothetical protein